jgi:hypothetical protein
VVAVEAGAAAAIPLISAVAGTAAAIFVAAVEIAAAGSADSAASVAEPSVEPAAEAVLAGRVAGKLAVVDGCALGTEVMTSAAATAQDNRAASKPRRGIREEPVACLSQGQRRGR